MKTKLPARQKEVLKLITDYYVQNAYPCSNVWLARKLGIAKSTLGAHVNHLVNKGLVRKTPDSKPYPTPVDK